MMISTLLDGIRLTSQFTLWVPTILVAMASKPAFASWSIWQLRRYASSQYSRVSGDCGQLASIPMNSADLGFIGLFGSQNFLFARCDRSSNWKSAPTLRKINPGFVLVASAQSIALGAMNSVRATAFSDRRN